MSCSPGDSERFIQGKRLLIAAGGTGGHIYPGLAVARKWRDGGGEAAFAGAPGNLEERIVPEAGYVMYPVVVRGFTRGRSLEARAKALKALLLLATLGPIRDALRVIREYRPDVILGVGGYVCGPTLLAGFLTRTPTMILQLDARAGLANRVAGQFVTAIGAALPEFGTSFRRKSRVEVVGNPIRDEVMTATADRGREEFRLEANRSTLLVFGGSLGSRAINQALVGALLLLGREWGERRQVIHVTGRANPAQLSAAEAERLGLKYRAMEYCDQMPLALAAADLAVTRSGATTVAELTARGIPAILIPWAGAADNHQEGNARALERLGAARVILDRELSAESLAAAIRELMDDDDRLVAMGAASRKLGAPEAASTVAQVLGRIARQQPGREPRP